MRALDWSCTPLGPMDGWPASLKTIVGTLLHSRHPMFLWWGPELIQIYNDAYMPSFGQGKHPAAMGQRGADCWQEIWPIIWPQIDDVMRRRTASWHEDHLVPIFRNGRIEEVYWTYGYSPVFDDDGEVGGTLVVCTETTSRVLSDRRLRSLRELTDALTLAVDVQDVLAAATAVLADAGADVPFALIYRTDGPSARPTLATAIGISGDAAAALDAHLLSALDVLPGDDATRPVPDGIAVSSAPWPEPVSTVFAAPIGSDRHRSGLVLFGLSPRLSFDAPYRDYLLQLTQQLAHAHARIEALQVRERGQAERERLLQDLQSASRAKDEFLAMLGHELRNPLSPILTALQLMRIRGVRGADRERAIIERQVTHVVGLVDDLLDVSRITRGVIGLKRERVRLADAVAKAIEQASPLIEQRRHRLTIDVPELYLDADSSRLAQIVANLLTNAAKYTEPDGHIDVRADRHDDVVELHVRDNGIGISAEMLPHVFDAFAQEGQRSDRPHGGLGLGLAIVRNLVEAHGGTVALHSDGKGRGTECVVRLPLSAGGVAQERPDVTDRPAGPATGCRILLVDDNEDAAEMLAASLVALGHHVEMAFDAPRALELAGRYVPDVALLDLGLPVIDGYELAARLRLQEGWRAVRFAALTGYAQQHDRERTAAAGFHAHLVKPIDLDAIDAMLRRLVRSET